MRGAGYQEPGMKGKAEDKPKLTLVLGDGERVIVTLESPTYATSRGRIWYLDRADRWHELLFADSGNLCEMSIAVEVLHFIRYEFDPHKEGQTFKCE
jgi:hypothetical protein